MISSYKPFLLSFMGICLIAFLPNASASENSQKIKNFSKNEYKAEYQNWGIDIGADNYIYTANNAGLLVYDGVNWEFNTRPEINNIRAVKVDPKNNRIYTAGYREIGYWEWDSLGMLNYHSFGNLINKELISNEEFWKIVIFEDQVIFQSFQSLYILKNNRFEILRPGGFMNSISLVNNDLFIHILNRGIYILLDNEIVSYLEDPFFDQKLIRFLLRDNDDQLIIGTASNGIYKFDGRKFYPAYTNYKEYLETNTINRICMLENGVLVIGTILDGIIGINPDETMAFSINEEQGLQNNTVLSIANNKNNLWLALDRGVSYIDLSINNSYNIHQTNEIGASYTAAVFQDKLFLGTNQGLYQKPLESNDKDFKLVYGTQGQVWDCKVIDNKLFVSHNDGTLIIDGNEPQKISNVGGGFSIINNPFQSNTLIQSSYSNIQLFKKTENKWSVSHNIANFSNLIRFIEIDHHNNLWAAHMRRGIYRLKLNDAQDSVLSSRYYGENSIFNQEYGIKVFKMENRIVFTTGKQIYTYDDLNDSIIPFDKINEQLGIYATAHRIIPTQNHHYWIITPTNIGLFQCIDMTCTLIKTYPSEIFDNHIIEGYENIIPLDNNQAIYCLENGYAILNTRPDIIYSGKKKKSVIPRKIAIADRSGNETRLALNKDKYIIPYTKNSLRLQYAFPDYNATKLKFKLHLEGLTPQWLESQQNANFEINRIPSGEYLIQVMAENEWHQESSIHEFQLKILSPWYRSIVAWVSYILILVLVIYWVRYTSVKRIKEKEKKKRDVKEQELTKLRNQNLRYDLKFKSRELANSTMSIIKKNEFLLELKETLKDQKYQLGTRYPDKFYNNIQKKIDKNISAGDDWKIFETNVEHAHEFFLQKLINEYPQLTHSDLRLCTYLRMNLSSKEIAPLMKISVRGVENHRYRLRKKLNLDASINLTDFILAFEI